MPGKRGAAGEPLSGRDSRNVYTSRLPGTMSSSVGRPHLRSAGTAASLPWRDNAEKVNAEKVNAEKQAPPKVTILAMKKEFGIQLVESGSQASTLADMDLPKLPKLVTKSEAKRFRMVKTEVPETDVPKRDTVDAEEFQELERVAMTAFGMLTSKSEAASSFALTSITDAAGQPSNAVWKSQDASVPKLRTNDILLVTAEPAGGSGTTAKQRLHEHWHWACWSNFGLWRLHCHQDGKQESMTSFRAAIDTGNYKITQETGVIQIKVHIISKRGAMVGCMPYLCQSGHSCFGHQDLVVQCAAWQKCRISCVVITLQC